jgi:hypothetical protein
LLICPRANLAHKAPVKRPPALGRAA